MLLDEGMDTGAMLKKAEVLLDAKETTGSLFHKLAAVGAETLIDVLGKLDEYEQNAEPQNEEEATYSAKIEKETARIDWTQRADVIERLIRTLDPHPGAYTVFEEKRLKIWAADVVPGGSSAAGTIIDIAKDSFTVQAGTDALRIYEVQPESRKRMTAAQFLQGISLHAGNML